MNYVTTGKMISFAYFQNVHSMASWKTTSRTLSPSIHRNFYSTIVVGVLMQYKKRLIENNVLPKFVIAGYAIFQDGCPMITVLYLKGIISMSTK